MDDDTALLSHLQWARILVRSLSKAQLVASGSEGFQFFHSVVVGSSTQFFDGGFQMQQQWCLRIGETGRCEEWTTH